MFPVASWRVSPFLPVCVPNRPRCADCWADRPHQPGSHTPACLKAALKRLCDAQPQRWGHIAHAEVGGLQQVQRHFQPGFTHQRIGGNACIFQAAAQVDSLAWNAAASTGTLQSASGRWATICRTRSAQELSCRCAYTQPRSASSSSALLQTVALQGSRGVRAAQAAPGGFDQRRIGLQLPGTVREGRRGQSWAAIRCHPFRLEGQSQCFVPGGPAGSLTTSQVVSPAIITAGPPGRSGLCVAEISCFKPRSTSTSASLRVVSVCSPGNCAGERSRPPHLPVAGGGGAEAVLANGGYHVHGKE